MSAKKDVNLVGWGDYFPSCKYSNEDICKILGLSLEKSKEYEEKYGFIERAWCVDQDGR